MKLSRRTIVLGSLALPAISRAEDNPIAALERKVGGRLGVSILNTGTGARLDHRQDERFAMCSTFKLLAVSLLLTRVDKRQDDLDRRIHFTKESLISYSPVTEKFTAEGMTLAELCSAALTMSDNTAANLILASIGGPPAVTAYARSIGDNLTRLDRNEPTLNEARAKRPARHHNAVSDAEQSSRHRARQRAFTGLAAAADRVARGLSDRREEITGRASARLEGWGQNRIRQ